MPSSDKPGSSSSTDRLDFSVNLDLAFNLVGCESDELLSTVTNTVCKFMYMHWKIIFAL